MLRKSLFLSSAALALVANLVVAAESSRVRLMIPIQGTYSGDKFVNAGATVESSTPGGYSLQYVTSAGWGVGYSSTSIEQKEKYNDQEYKTNYDATYLELLYTFGAELTGQIFYGHQLSSSDVDWETNGVKGSTSPLKTKSTSGSAIGLNGGYDFGGFEALLGYRQESSTWQEDASSSKEMKLDRSLVNVGIGFTF